MIPAIAITTESFELVGIIEFSTLSASTSQRVSIRLGGHFAPQSSSGTSGSPELQHLGEFALIIREGLLKKRGIDAVNALRIRTRCEAMDQCGIFLESACEEGGPLSIYLHPSREGTAVEFSNTFSDRLDHGAWSKTCEMGVISV